jgi:hypothetical protein
MSWMFWKKKREAEQVKIPKRGEELREKEKTEQSPSKSLIDIYEEQEKQLYVEKSKESD